MEENYADFATNVAFNYLKKTNKLMIVNDKDDMFFTNFFNKYKLCHISLVRQCI